MFLTGHINENLEPVIENVFLVCREKPVLLDAILDTGYNGMLCLPRQSPPPRSPRVAALASWRGVSRGTTAIPPQATVISTGLFEKPKGIRHLSCPSKKGGTKEGRPSGAREAGRVGTSARGGG